MLNILVHFLHIQEIDLKKLAKRPGYSQEKAWNEKKNKKKKTEIARKNFELQNLDTGTLKNQKIFDVNISFEKEKKQERESLILDKIKENVPLDNDHIHVKYNPDDNSYELKIDDQKDEKEYIIKRLYELNKKL